MAQRLNIDIVARDKSKQALNNVRGALSKVKGAVFNLQSAFVGLGAGLVIRNLVNTGRELENLQVRLKFLLKDTNEGAKAFENMVKFASKVPFSLEEIQAGSGILATVTDNANDLQKMLEITGNVAAVTGLDFRTTAEQIQRSFSAVFDAADLFREKGVRNMLGFQAGAEVSITQTVEAFEKVFGKAGRFGKATDELATTLTGTLSMIGDKAFSFKKTLLDAGFFAELKNQFGSLDKALARNSEQIDRIAIGFGTVLAKSVQGIAGFFKILKDNIDLVITALKLLIAVKIVTFMISLGKAIMVVLAGLRGIAAVSGVGLPLVAAKVPVTATTEAATKGNPTPETAAIPLKPARTTIIALPKEIINVTILTAIRSFKAVITKSMLSFNILKNPAIP
jgi:phage tail tape-measure protein